MFLKLTLITLLTAIIIATKSDPKAAKCLRPGQTVCILFSYQK